MTDQPTDDDEAKHADAKTVGQGQGGADSSGSGNILAGVQPKVGDDRDETERRDGGRGRP